MPRKKMLSTVTLGELDRAVAAYQKSLREVPGDTIKGVVKAVFAALKNFEKDRGLLKPNGSR